jgi:hypothetical protein
MNSLSLQNKFILKLV